MNQNAVAVPNTQTPDKERYPLYTGQVLGGGACRSIGKLYNRLLERNHITSDDNNIRDLLRSPAFRPTVRYTFLKLVKITPEQMGLPDGGTLLSIQTQAQTKEYNLHLLPMDTAPFLILQLRSGQLAADPSIVVASEPVVLSGSSLIFEVRNGKLHTISGAPTAYFKKDQPLLLRRF